MATNPPIELAGYLREANYYSVHPLRKCTDDLRSACGDPQKLNKMAMDTKGFKRKLSAILSADVVGYSRLMEEDEEATVRTLNKYEEMIFELIERHNGRLWIPPVIIY